MYIQGDCEIALAFPGPTQVALMRRLHPSLDRAVQRGDRLSVEPAVPDHGVRYRGRIAQTPDTLLRPTAAPAAFLDPYSQRGRC